MALILSGDTGVPASGMPAGSVIQTVNATYGSVTSSTTSTYANTGISTSITPTASTSKILVTIYCGMSGKNATDTQLNLRIQRNSTAIFDAAAVNQGTAVALFTNPTLVYLDSPATTSSTTYTLQIANRDNAGTVYVNTNGTATITLQEIKV